MNDYHKATLDKKKIGFLIRSAIADSGLTIERISMNLEFTSSRVIYEWMSGTKLPSLESFANLALMLNKKMEDLIALR